MHFGLNRKVAMVAGASRGLGLGVARALAAEGVTVSMASRDAAKVEAAAASIAEETKADVLGVAADVRSAEAIELWFETTKQRFGGVDLLFTNSGGPPAGTALSFDDAAWQSAFELLLQSALRMIRLAVPSMALRGAGSIVIPLGTAYKASGCVPASATLLSQIESKPSGFYVNIHNVAYPQGVVRGQL